MLTSTNQTIAAAVSSPEHRLAVGATCRLDQAGQYLAVASGRIELYVSIGETRRFLAELGPGAMLFGAAATGLLGLAPEGAVLRVVPASEIDELASDPFRASQLAAHLDLWTRAVSDGLMHLAPSRPTVTPAVPDEAIIGAQGDSMSAARGVLWLDLRGGAPVSFLGSIRPDISILPLTPSTWISLDQPTRFIGHTTLNIIQAGNWKQAIADLHAIAVAMLSHALEHQQAAEQARLEERERLTLNDLVSANERLVGVLSARHQAPEASSDADFVLDLVTGKRLPSAPGAARPADLRANAQARGLRARTINLTGDWWHEDRGHFAGFVGADKIPVALIPDWRGRYHAHQRGQRPQRLTPVIVSELDPQALSFTEPLPNRPVSARDLAMIGVLLCRTDIATIAVASLAASVLGLLTPIAIGRVIDTFIPDHLQHGVILLGVALVLLNICSALLRACSDMARLRMDGKLSAAIQTGVMDRVLRLPSRFLKSQASADLALRVLSIEQMRRMLTNTVLSSVISGIFGLSSFALLFYYSPPAALAALVLFALFLAVAVAAGVGQLRAIAVGDAMNANLTSLTLQLIQNVSTLRAFGAERRAFARWARNTAAMRSRLLRSRFAYIGFETFLAAYDGLALATVFAILGYAVGGEHLSTGSYLAFVATYQGFLGSSEGLGRAIVQVIGAQPTLKRASVLLAATPESSPTARDPGPLSGQLEISGVSFSYEANAPLILNGVSFLVESGKFVALAGPSGCGKSTLINLILGFDQPAVGTVLFDGHDLGTLDKAAVRRQIGVVRQSGRLLAGSVFENLIGIHEGTVDDAWAAAELAGIAADIRQLPMGLHTVLNEGVPTFSGGQVQRLLLARALVGRPKLLILDEATSALDNVTQAGITANIERLGITRLVVAHRLSTIRNADTIHFISEGKIRESGTFVELMKANGPFSQFARRQTF